MISNIDNMSVKVDVVNDIEPRVDEEHLKLRPLQANDYCKNNNYYGSTQSQS